jgi:hypothetical protein
VSVGVPWDDLPGAELVERGVLDLAAGRHTAEALLVAIGAPRLRALGFDLPEALPEEPERALWVLLDTSGQDVHSAFNALRRRLVSFQRALERRVVARSTTDPSPPN